MNDRYNSTTPARTVTAIAFAVVLSTTCLLGAVAPAHVQAATVASAAAATNSLVA